jgi:hypothetical protein
VAPTGLTLVGSIIRILFMVPVYAISSFMQLQWYWRATYFSVISDCYEAFAIASFFGMICHYCAPDLGLGLAHQLVRQVLRRRQRPVADSKERPHLVQHHLDRRLPVLFYPCCHDRHGRPY